MNFTRKRRERSDLIDLTPMIDVVMQLIIFFMYTNQFAQVVRTQLDLPKEPGEKRDDPEPASIVIDMTANGSLLVEGEPVTRADLLLRVSTEVRAGEASGKPPTVLLRADRSAASKHLNELATELVKLGVRDWRLGTSPSANGGR